MATAVTLTKGTIPVGFCHSTWQHTYETFIDATTASISGATNSFNYGPTTPSVDNQDRPWIRTDANYNIEGLYVYSTQYSKWLRKHPMPPDTVIMWTGAIAGVDTFDGGEAGVVTPTTGPIWEKYAAMDGRFPVAPGTLDQGTVVALAGTGGTEKVSLAATEMPPHTHDIKGRNLSEFTSTNQTPDHIIIDDDYVSGVITKATESAGGSSGVVAAHQNLPPYLGINFIRRTSRLYIRAI